MRANTGGQVAPLEGEAIPCANHDALAAIVAEAADCIPFYIHHVVDRLTGKPTPVTTDMVAEVITAFLTDAQDAWDMSHYRKRIETYYPADEQKNALALLDVLAAEENPLNFAALFNRLSAKIHNADEERTREVLTLLQRDHYCILQPDGTYRFYLALIQRWWKLHRGLSS